MANHIFISYSRKDSDFAKDLKKKLEAADVEVLERMGDAAVPALSKVLDDQRPAVRQRAANALGRMGDAAVPALIEALDNQRPAVRQGAAEALGQIEGPRRFERLRSVIRSVTRRA